VQRVIDLTDARFGRRRQELFDTIVEEGALTEARAAQVVRQVADATAFLHAQGLCHADIKPENLLLTSKDADAAVKLVDFGLTTEVRSVGKSKPGTWAYWPPEAFGSGNIGSAAWQGSHPARCCAHAQTHNP
jgi:serine/threonine protein kinase